MDVSSATGTEHFPGIAKTGEVKATVTAPPTNRAPSAAAIRDWLIAELAGELVIAPSEVDIQQPCTYYGLASVEGATMADKLEQWLGRPVPLGLVWDCPTIEAVAGHLGSWAEVA